MYLGSSLRQTRCYTRRDDLAAAGFPSPGPEPCALFSAAAERAPALGLGLQPKPPPRVSITRRDN